MAWYLDRVQLWLDLQNKTNPILELLEAYRDHEFRRLDPDHPRPYVSPTESEERVNDDSPTPPRDDPLPECVKAIMDRPIKESEFQWITYLLQTLATPSQLYCLEVKREEYRLRNYRLANLSRFRDPKVVQQYGVIVRHNIKRRWEKLGIWNPEWGFPGRNVKHYDDVAEWEWRWRLEQHDANDSRSGDLEAAAAPRELVARALRLRQNLRRGENAPAIPRSHLKPNATASEAESFIISRPWFIFQLEVAEEAMRYEGLSLHQQQGHPPGERKQVIKWWKERGDWREEFNEKGWVNSWKWRHESPSPEPENLTFIDNMKDGALDITDMDFTPSEIDELETTELPSSKQPEKYWEEWWGSGQPHFPGQLPEFLKRSYEFEKRFEEWSRARGSSPDDAMLQEFLEFDKRFEEWSRERASSPDDAMLQEFLKNDTFKPQQDNNKFQPQRAFSPISFGSSIFAAPPQEKTSRTEHDFTLEEPKNNDTSEPQQDNNKFQPQRAFSPISFADSIFAPPSEEKTSRTEHDLTLKKLKNNDTSEPQQNNNKFQPQRASSPISFADSIFAPPRGRKPSPTEHDATLQELKESDTSKKASSPISFGEPIFASPSEEKQSPTEHDARLQEPEESNTSQPQQDTTSNLSIFQNPPQNPPRQHQHQHQRPRQQRNKVNKSRNPNRDPDQPPLRRSARIAGMKRPRPR